MSETLTQNVLNDDNQIGDVKISNEAIGVIASIAAKEVEGVDSMAGRLTKSAKMDIKDGIVTAEVSIIMKNGYNVPDVSVKVQERIKSAIESMTGLTVATVNVKITGVSAS